MGQFFSPYLAMGNDPVGMVDPTGGISHAFFSSPLFLSMAIGGISGGITAGILAGRNSNLSTGQYFGSILGGVAAGAAVGAGAYYGVKGLSNLKLHGNELMDIIFYISLTRKGPFDSNSDTQDWTEEAVVGFRLVVSENSSGEMTIKDETLETEETFDDNQGLTSRTVKVSPFTKTIDTEKDGFNLDIGLKLSATYPSLNLGWGPISFGTPEYSFIDFRYFNLRLSPSKTSEGEIEAVAREPLNGKGVDINRHYPDLYSGQFRFQNTQYRMELFQIVNGKRQLNHSGSIILLQTQPAYSTY